MRTIQDKHGLPVDQIKYKKSGERDYAHLHPMVFLTTDTLRTAKLKAGVPTSMFVRVANVDPERYKEGTLIIGSKFKGLIAQDTIFMLDAKPSKGFEYPFTPTKLGSNLINGLLVLHSEEAGQTPKLFNLECKFEVVD